MEISMEELDRYADQKRRALRNEYNKRNPDHVMQNRVTSSANLLLRFGLIDSKQHTNILSAWDCKRAVLYPPKGGARQ